MTDQTPPRPRGRPRRDYEPADAHVRLDATLAAWLCEPYLHAGEAPDLPNALRETAQVWRALCLAAYPRIRAALSEADLRACLDVANGLILTAGFIGQHLAVDLHDHGDPAYAATSERVAALHPADRAALELWCRAWWGAPDDDVQDRVWKRVAGAGPPGLAHGTPG
jgi:hypothetical protein